MLTMIHLLLMKLVLFRSTVIADLRAKSEVSEIRTSSGMFIDKAADDVIARIEQRISEWTFLPVPNQEAMQVSWRHVHVPVDERLRTRETFAC